MALAAQMSAKHLFNGTEFSQQPSSQLISLKIMTPVGSNSRHGAASHCRSSRPRLPNLLTSPAAAPKRLAQQQQQWRGRTRATSFTDTSQLETITNTITTTTSTTAQQFPRGYYNSSGRLMLKNLTLPELDEWCASIGEESPSKRAMHLWRWMYYDRQWLRSLDEAPAGEVTNGFSAVFRDKLRNLATLDGGLEVVSVHSAADTTRKIIFRLTAGPAAGGQVETVIIPITRESGSKQRMTVCVSSQVGCAQNCQFCFTGRMGLLGNLTPAQIVEQLVVARRMLFEEDGGVAIDVVAATTGGARGSPSYRHITPITNVVFMGM